MASFCTLDLVRASSDLVILPIRHDKQIDFERCSLFPDRKGNVIHLEVSKLFQEPVTDLKSLAIDQTSFGTQTAVLFCLALGMFLGRCFLAFISSSS